MKAISIILASFFSFLGSFFLKTSEMNQLNDTGTAYYKNGEYEKASFVFNKLIYKYKSKDERIYQNLANSLFLSEKYKESKVWYEKLCFSQEKDIRSLAWNQLGIIAYVAGDENEAFKCLRNSLVENHRNNMAIYNYELLKKIKDPENQDKFIANSKAVPDEEGQQSDKKEKKKQPAPAEDGNKKDKKGGNRELDQNGKSSGETAQAKNRGNDQKLLGENSKNSGNNQSKKEDNKGQSKKDQLVSQKLESLGIPRAQAIQLLDGMQSQEIRYLQQLKHKSAKKSKDLPDY